MSSEAIRRGIAKAPGPERALAVFLVEDIVLSGR